MPSLPGARPHLNPWVLAVTALLGGTGAALAFAPTGWMPLVLIGPAVGLWAAASARRPVAGAACGLAFGLGFAYPALRWMLEVDPLAGFVLPLIQGMFWAVTGAAAAAATRLHPAWWVPVVAAVWTLTEAARARVPLTGFEWAQLAMAVTDTPARHAAAVVGALGLTALLATVAAALALLMRSRGRARVVPLIVAIALLLATATVGAVRWTVPDGALDVAVVQVDDPCPGEFAADCPGYIDALVTDYVARSADVDGGADLIVWGEDALPGAATLDAAGSALLARSGGLAAPVLAGVGTPTSPGRFLRWAALFGADGAPIDAYAKRMPVPFGEYVPWRSVLGGISDVGRLVPSDLEAGDDASPVELSTGDGVARLGTVVSWEVTFARAVRAVAHDANGLATLTTVASYGTSATSDQLLDASQLRVAEQQKPMVVAATTGRSAFIDADGVIAGRSALFRGDTLTGTMQLRSGLTPYARAGDLPIVLLAAAVLIGAWIARPRSGRSADDPGVPADVEAPGRANTVAP
ncbi:MAG TPA: apolipoprotein N-acyltransferase [Euzebyales bacterium]